MFEKRAIPKTTVGLPTWSGNPNRRLGRWFGKRTGLRIRFRETSGRGRATQGARHPWLSSVNRRKPADSQFTTFENYAGS